MEKKKIVNDFRINPIPGGFECLGSFDKNGYAKARKDGFWGYVDENLEWVVPPSFDMVSGNFVGNETRVKRYLRWRRLGSLPSVHMANGQLLNSMPWACPRAIEAHLAA